MACGPLRGLRLGLLGLAFAAGEPEAVCLLSLRSTRLEPKEALADAQAWERDHALRHAALASVRQSLSHSAAPPALAVNLDAFIAASRSSTDACHARTLEAKRTLDGLTHQVTALSDQMSGQSKVIETNTAALEQAIADKQSADSELRAALQACDDAANTTALLQYRAELDELEQIAEPNVRSQIAEQPRVNQDLAEQTARAEAVAEHAVTAQSEDELLAGAQQIVDASRSSLLQLTDTACRRYVTLLQTKASAGGIEHIELSCNETRTKLQQQFQESYYELSLLYKNSATAAADMLADCKATARTEHEGKITAVNLQIQQGTKLILAAKDVMSALDPLLDDVAQTTNQVTKHIKWLEQNCHVESSVTEHLRKVRDLIDTLSVCPGRNDFKLTVPSLDFKSGR